MPSIWNIGPDSKVGAEVLLQKMQPWYPVQSYHMVYKQQIHFLVTILEIKELADANPHQGPAFMTHYHHFGGKVLFRF